MNTLTHTHDDEHWLVFAQFLFSEIAQLIQQVNQLQSQSDTLYDQNEALRLRLGMGPDEIVDLKEVCTFICGVIYMYMFIVINKIRNRKEKEIESLKEDNRTLVMKIEKLEEEKLTLKRKLVDQSYVSRYVNQSSIHVHRATEGFMGTRLLK